ncbi:succinate-semialdehyde dehydrogenase/glutarate-semialdehyde dehydrogenase [Pseudoclavibacter chungangensis]|uniref:NAD-dependent succinate-semialdehyde dehydrogenase n=1 Tax=Pseudoclavibacter chungangensis TaxID=587635 RepID=UPI0015C86522|nr:NAD-dependent succinate-semialdehyde dehydrogenase [Pseudoclavibacter chungangensis]NYJ68181.1 succinate-semialdehyde dehydrogenase/glutarate-semialdehyde dehydrogenase [Pseudoclavibacter chungangensis]
MPYATTNPYTGEVVRTFDDATPEQIDAAIERADATFQEWRNTSPEERAAVLREAARLLRADKRRYAEILTLEMGKLIAEAEAEVELSAKILEYYVDKGAELLKPRYLPAEGFGSQDVQLVNQPLGVLFAVEPWNFPYYQVIRITAPQVTAGNTVLLKHASNVPQSALAMESLFREAGAPEGLLTNLFVPHSATERIIGDPRVRGVALTGSERAGAAIAALAAENLKKSTLELGGADAFIVLDDADVQKAADWAVFGRHWNAGQVCVSSKRLIVDDAVYDDFLARYREGVEALKAGDPLDPSTTLAPLSSQKAADDLAAQVVRAREEGVTVEAIGSPVPEQGAFYVPTLLTDIPEDGETFVTEFFGPVTQLYRATDEADAIRIANASPFGLGGSVFTNDPERGQRVSRALETGMVYINQPTGVKADIPFGGVKHSGYGHELIDLGITEFVNQKAVVVSDIDGSF